MESLGFRRFITWSVNPSDSLSLSISKINDVISMRITNMNHRTTDSKYIQFPFIGLSPWTEVY